MRKDEGSNECPATLGEYRDLCAAFGGEDCDAVRFLDEKIAATGRDDEVIVSDAVMRSMLMPMLIKRSGVSHGS